LFFYKYLLCLFTTEEDDDDDDDDDDIMDEATITARPVTTKELEKELDMWTNLVTNMEEAIDELDGEMNCIEDRADTMKYLKRTLLKLEIHSKATKLCILDNLLTKTEATQSKKRERLKGKMDKIDMWIREAKEFKSRELGCYMMVVKPYMQSLEEEGEEVDDNTDNITVQIAQDKVIQLKERMQELDKHLDCRSRNKKRKVKELEDAPTQSPPKKKEQKESPPEPERKDKEQKKFRCDTVSIKFHLFSFTFFSKNLLIVG
jgi:hypothetical protein